MSLDSTYPSPWKRVAREFRAMLQTLPAEVSTIAANDFRENFRRQGYINRGGVLIPWRKRAFLGTGRNRTRATLVKTGFLLRSNRPAAFGMTARVINSADYASAHNDGFKGTVSVKSHSRGLYTTTKVNSKTKAGKNRTVNQRTLNAVTKVKAHSRTMNLPKRTFMVNSPVLDKAIDQHINQRLEKIWQRQ